MGFVQFDRLITGFYRVFHGFIIVSGRLNRVYRVFTVAIVVVTAEFSLFALRFYRVFSFLPSFFFGRLTASMICCDATATADPPGGLLFTRKTKETRRQKGDESFGKKRWLKWFPLTNVLVLVSILHLGLAVLISTHLNLFRWFLPNFTGFFLGHTGFYLDLLGFT